MIEHVIGGGDALVLMPTYIDGDYRRILGGTNSLCMVNYDTPVAWDNSGLNGSKVGDHKMRSWMGLAAAASIVITVFCTACSPPVPTDIGTVTSAATLCAGIAPPRSSVTVYARHEGHVVASRRVLQTQPKRRYSMSLPPGSYVISAPQSGVPAQHAHVRAGATVRINFLLSCK